MSSLMVRYELPNIELELDEFEEVFEMWRLVWERISSWLPRLNRL